MKLEKWDAKHKSNASRELNERNIQAKLSMSGVHNSPLSHSSADDSDDDSGLVEPSEVVW